MNHKICCVLLLLICSTGSHLHAQNSLAAKSEIRVAPVGHVNFMVSTDLSGTQQHVLTGGGDGRIVLWDIATKKIIRSMQYDRESPVLKVLFKNENRQAISLHGPEIPQPGQNPDLNPNHAIALWDLNTGDLIQKVEFRLNGFPSMDFDGERSVLISDGNHVRLLDLPDDGSNFQIETLNLQSDKIGTAYFQNSNSKVIHVLSENPANSNLEDAIYNKSSKSLTNSTKFENYNFGKLKYCFDQTLIFDWNDRYEFMDAKRGFRTMLNKERINEYMKKYNENTQPGDGNQRMTNDQTGVYDGFASFNSDGSKLAIGVGTARPFLRPIHPAKLCRVLIIDVATGSLDCLSPETDTRKPPVGDVVWFNDNQSLLTIDLNRRLQIDNLLKRGTTWELLDISTGIVFFDLPAHQNGLLYAKRDSSSGYWNWSFNKSTDEFEDTNNKFIKSFGAVEDMITATDKGGDIVISKWENQVSSTVNFQELWRVKSRLMSVCATSTAEQLYIGTTSSPQSAVLLKYNQKNNTADPLLSIDESLMKEVSLSASENYIAIKYFDLTQYNGELQPNYKYWDVQAGREKILTGFKNTNIRYHSFSSTNDRAISVSESNECIIWNTKTGNELHRSALPDPINDLVIDANKNRVLYILKNGRILSYDYSSRDVKEIGFPGDDYIDPVLSHDGRYLYTRQINSSDFVIIDIDAPSRQLSYPARQPYKPDGYTPSRKQIYFLKNGFALTGDVLGRYQLWDLQQWRLAAHLRLMNNKSWGVYTQEGAFDGNRDGRDQMYFVTGTEVVDFDQFSDRYWVPGLLQQIFERTYDPEEFENIDEIPLYPEIALSTNVTGDSINVELAPRPGGGIGRVSLKVRGVERNVNINPDLKQSFSFAIEDYGNYMINDENEIGIIAYDQTNVIESPLETILVSYPTGAKGSSSRQSESDKTPPHLYALFIGTSTYNSNTWSDLYYADKDAKDMEDALTKVGKDIYPGRIHTFRLTSESLDSTRIASKENIKKAFQAIQDAAKANDVIILFFSGHGKLIGEDFYYVTGEIGNSSVNEKYMISAAELNEHIRKINANKQVLILDACYSGQVANSFSKSANISEEKVWESMNKKMGVVVLASSGREVSYESTRLQQGILTCSLLFGLGGEAIRDNQSDKRIYINDLFSYATLKSEELSTDEIGAKQTPVTLTEKANNFEIGIQNDDFIYNLPKKLPRFGSPKIGINPSRVDPEKLEKGLNDFLAEKSRYVLHPEYVPKYVYTSKAVNDVFSITGNYEVVDAKRIRLTLYLVRNEQIISGPFTIEQLLTDKKSIYQETLNWGIEQAERISKDH